MPSGTIDNLNFEVLLDDSKFVKKVKDDIDLAEKLNTTLSTALKITGAIPDAKKIFDDNEAKKIRDIASAVKDLKGDLKGIEDGVKVVNDEVDKTAPSVDNANKSLGNTSDLMRTIAQLTGVAFSVATIRRFATELIETTGAFEVQKMALTSMLQDADKADEIFNNLRKNALESPYTFQDLAKFAKQLTAFNIPADQLVETEKRLADVAAGLGVDVGRIILAYGQVKAAGVLKGTELRQFTEAGVPVLEQLAKQIEEVEGRTISLSEVFQRVTKKEISFEMVEEAFRRMTSEGGKFYNMQDVLVQTLQGKIGKLRDVWQQALYDMGTNNEKLLKGAVDAVTNLVSHLEDLGKIIPEIVAAFGAFKTVQIILAAVNAETFAAVAANSKLLSSLKAIGAWIAKNPYALIAAALAAIVVKSVQTINEINELNNRVKTFAADTATAVDEEIDKLNKLDAKLVLAEQGTDEWNNAKREAIDTYGKYFDGLDAEIDRVGHLGEAYDTLTAAVEKSVKERSYLEFKKQEEDSLNELIEGMMGDLKKGLAKNFTGAQAYYIMQSLRKTLKSGGDIGDFKRDALYNDPEVIKMIQDARYGFLGHKTVEAVIASILANNRGGRHNIENNLKELADLLQIDPSAIAAPTTTTTTTPTTTTWGNANKVERDNNKRIADLKREAGILERYLNIRKELERDFFGGDTAAASDWMGGVVKGKDASYFSGLETSIQGAVTELRTLGDAGNDAADAIEGRLGTDALSVAKKELQANKKAAEEYERAEKKISEYLSKNFGTEGEKTAAKISKLLADLASANAKADNTVKNLTDTLDKEKEAVVKKYLETIKDNGLSEEEQKKLADAYWEEYRTNRIKEIKAQAQQEKDYNNRNTREKIRGLAKNIFNEQMEGFDLTNWGDKSLSQINAIRDALSKMDVPEDIRKELEGDSKLLQMLIDELKTLAQGKIDKTVDPERWKKIGKQAKYIAQQFLSVSNSLKEYGEATGNRGLVQAADAVGRIAQNMKAAEEGAKAWGGWWGAIIGGVTDLITQLVDGFTEAETKAAQLRDNLREVIRDAGMEDFKNELADVGKSLFGDDALARIHQAVKDIKELEDINKPLTNHYPNPDGRMPGYYTNPSRFITAGNHTMELSWYAHQVGGALFDANGNLDASTLRDIITAYTDLDSESKQWLLDAIDYSEKYQLALDEIANVTASIVDDLAGDAADAIVDQWIEAGNAALDYADILDDVAKRYAKMLIQSEIQKNILDPITEDLMTALKEDRYGDAMALVAGAMQKVQDSAPVFENILKAFDPYFKAAEGSDDSSSVGKGIKSITEETASLLASYLNAIRADVSYMRSMAESGWLNVENIARAITPNLADYVQQIAANTYNTAENTATILSELQSVIGAPGATSPMVLRVEMA